MRRVGSLLVTLALSVSSAVSAHAQADSTPSVDRMPALNTLVRLKPMTGVSGDWILGTLTFAAMQGQRCLVLVTHMPDAPAWVVRRGDSLELAWRGGSAMRPGNRAQIDSMAAGTTWHRVNTAKALEGMPECLPAIP